MKIKDKRAFVVYVLLTVVLWQFLISISKIIKHNTFNLDFIKVVETTNSGAAFGMFQNAPFVLGMFGLIVLLLVLFYVYKNVNFEDKAKILFLSIFSAGILGNTHERFAYGYVTDFIKINFLNFPVFNMFDILISISVILYAVFYIKEEIFKRIKNGNKSRKA